MLAVSALTPERTSPVDSGRPVITDDSASNGIVRSADAAERWSVTDGARARAAYTARLQGQVDAYVASQAADLDGMSADAADRWIDAQRHDRYEICTGAPTSADASERCISN